MRISRRSGLRRKLQTSQSQTTTDWLVIAGVFRRRTRAGAKRPVAAAMEGGSRYNVAAADGSAQRVPYLSTRSQPPTLLCDAVAKRWQLLRHKLASSPGQTTTEWLITAGALAAMAAFIGRVGPAALRAFVGGLTWGIRTIAP
jgi:hypothetical protein